jgi:general stress protein 26
MATAGTARGQLSKSTEEALRTSSEIYLATERKDGAMSSSKPVWFYYEGGKELFFTTSPGSWKVRRLERGSPLHVWVGGKDGPHLVGKARKVTDPALVDRMGRGYGEKYWIAWLGFFKPRSSRVTEGKTVAYLVELTEAKK